MPGPSTFGPKLVSGFTPTGTAKPYVPSFGPNLSALPASFTPSFSMGSGMSVAQAATFLAANANNPQVKTVPPAAHVIVYSALTGAPEESSQASETILNATSAASSPNATPAQTALADALALAHKIQVHAQYVQKWFGPAEAAKYFNAGYITVQDLQ